MCSSSSSSSSRVVVVVVAGAVWVVVVVAVEISCGVILSNEIRFVWPWSRYH